MSINEVRTYVYRCDQCRTLSDPVQTTNGMPPNLPDDWESVLIEPTLDDRYDIYGTEHLLCPACLAQDAERSGS